MVDQGFARTIVDSIILHLQLPKQAEEWAAVCSLLHLALI